MKKYLTLIFLSLLMSGACLAQKVPSINFHEPGKTYPINALVTVDGVIYKSSNITSTTPPSVDWEELGLIDGSETILNSGTNTSVSGDGTSGNPYIINVPDNLDNDISNEIQNSSEVNLSTPLDVDGDSVNENTVQEAIEKIPSIASTIKAVDEGNGIGYILNSDRINYRNVGLDAIELITRFDDNNIGAAGEVSFGAGQDITLRDYGTYGIGYDIVVGNNTQFSSFASGALGSEINIAGVGNHGVGTRLTINAGNNNTGYSFVGGTQNTHSGVAGGTIGAGLLNKSIGTFVVGAANLDYTLNNSNANLATDPAFIVGNGTLNGSTFAAVTRSDAFKILKNGEITAPSTDIVDITNAGPKSLITDEYLQDQLSSSSKGYRATGDAGNGDLVIEIGDIDDENNSSKLTLNENSSTLNFEGEFTATDQVNSSEIRGDQVIVTGGSGVVTLDNQNVTSPITLEAPDKSGTIATLDDVSTSSFKDSGTGLPNVLTTTDIYREGRVGFNEPNPEEQVDIIGSFKQQYTFGTGEIVRNTFGGTNISTEDGLPSGALKTWQLDFRANPTNHPNMRSYAYGGDIGAINPTAGSLSFGAGISDLLNTKFARINIWEEDVNGNPNEEFVLALQNRNPDGNEVVFQLYNKGVSAGFDQESTSFLRTTGTNEASLLRITPHTLIFSDLVQLQGYGQGIYAEGYNHTDNLTDTGTAATQIGEMDHIAGFDANDNLMTIPIDNISKTVKISLTGAQIGFLQTTPIQAIPAPGVGKFIIVEEVIINKSSATANVSTLQIKANGANRSMFEEANYMDTIREFFGSIEKITNGFVASNQEAYRENEPIIITATSEDGFDNGSSIDVYITYRILNL